MFDITSLQYNTENPTLMAVGFTVICALMLGTIIAFTYEKTSSRVDRPDHFLQAMVLVTIVAATIIQAIGDSVARGLGMLGALSIIRFRTTVRDPRNIVFMFGAIAAGIACGVFGFLVAICGTLAFCCTAFILRFSSFYKKETMSGTLIVDIPTASEHLKSIEVTIGKYADRFKLSSFKLYTGLKKEGLKEHQYKIKLKDFKTWSDMISELKSFEGVNITGLEMREREFDNI